MLARLTILALLVGSSPLLGEEKPWIAKAGRDRTWHREHQQLVQRAHKDDISIYFLGDSLTAHWTSTGRAIWHLDLLPQKSANFGVSADRVQNILYRITRGELPKSDPKVFVLMLGTNNLAQKNADRPEDVSRGIKSVLASIKKHNPSSKILLLSILPSGNEPGTELRQSIRATNKQLATLADKKTVHYADIYDQFIDQNGKWKQLLSTDGTHLSARGYEKLYELIRKPLEKLSAN